MAKVSIDGVDIYYEKKGEGIPIIFIHPPLLTGTNFSYQLEHLSKKYQIITFDIRGHGRSDFSEKPVIYPLIVGDLLYLLDQLKIDKAFFCGYSIGGSIVLEFLQSHSHRAFGGVIISGMSEVQDRKLKFRIMTAAKFSSRKSIHSLIYIVAKSNTNTKQMFKKLQRESLKGNTRNIRQYYHYSLNYNGTEKLHHIHLPILLIYGMKDKAFHKYASILHEKLPNNELIFLENEKHQIPTKAPQKLHEAIAAFIQAYKRDNPFMV